MSRLRRCSCRTCSWMPASWVLKLVPGHSCDMRPEVAEAARIGILAVEAAIAKRVIPGADECEHSSVDCYPCCVERSGVKRADYCDACECRARAKAQYRKDSRRVQAAIRRLLDGKARR